ncbi:MULTISPECIES: hypothetical protein [unclassified Gordonia (in: high G+C Gram-positive bacteria)]|uniref:hypothetical protein n=1 Tax=unclassified Gordonia (in: high G+C Gram-positive bacteria) TaxID=2657482 RepID=UPI0019627D62|nr:MULTISPECIES: hypothetical protein [unclassified Gordonia (in: high G+C Gram-positive bacteria)]MBN0975109.1 hypothetical protein [Gordonia sp. BP-119]MBN0985282.1 hypothetical protein [Gordonia sp. BP-94]
MRIAHDQSTVVAHLRTQRPTTGVRDSAPLPGGGVDSNERTTSDTADQRPIQDHYNVFGGSGAEREES